MSRTTLDFHGQPAQALHLPSGDRVVVALHGAQLLSWTPAGGAEQIYLSPLARFDAHSAIRGGVPICWPQFNQRGPLPKHGFARTRAWQPEAAAADTLAFSLQDDDATRALWPHGFRLLLELQLAAQGLRLTLTVHNTGEAAFDFTLALHSYLRVQDVAQVRLQGLQGAQRWDAVRDVRSVETAEALRFDGEYDSVFAAPAAPLQLVESGRRLQIAQSATLTEAVVWNPGAKLAAELDDLPDDGYRQMLCAEAARIDKPVLLAPGAQWQAWQSFSLLP